MRHFFFILNKSFYWVLKLFILIYIILFGVDFESVGHMTWKLLRRNGL